MKKFLFFISLLFINAAYAADPLDKVESEVFTTNGTAAQITLRAKGCMAEILKNDNVGNSTTENLFSYAGEDKLVANARIEYTYLLLRRSVQSKYIFEAKEGRFRISETDIGYKIVETTGTLAWGSSVNSKSGHMPVVKVWGTGYEEVEAQLQAVNAKIADCVMNDKKSAW